MFKLSQTYWSKTIKNTKYVCLIKGILSISVEIKLFDSGVFSIFFVDGPIKNLIHNGFTPPHNLMYLSFSILILKY